MYSYVFYVFICQCFFCAITLTMIATITIAISIVHQIQAPSGHHRPLDNFLRASVPSALENKTLRRGTSETCVSIVVKVALCL